MAGTLGIVGAVSGVASAGAGLANAFGGGGSGGQSAGGLSNAQMTGAANQYLSGINAYAPYASGFASSFYPQAQSLTQQGANNPYGDFAQAGAGTASSYGTNTLFPQLANLSGLAADYAPQALATGFSNNNGLYQQNLQRTIDQSNVINSMYGLGTSAAGAGLTDQAAQNFNNQWNLQQAQLQNQAANTYSALANLSNTAGGAAFNAYNTATALPAQTYQGLNSNALQALTSGSNAAIGVASPLQNYFADLSSIWGQSQNAQQAAFNQSQTTGSNLGQSLSLLGGSAQNLYNNYGINPVNISPGINIPGYNNSYGDPGYYGYYG